MEDKSAQVKWYNRYSIQVAEIDDQHKRLISIIDQFSEAMLQRKGKDLVGRVLNELIRYTEAHSKLEEGYFDQFSYPEADAIRKSMPPLLER